MIRKLAVFLLLCAASGYGQLLNGPLPRALQNNASTGTTLNLLVKRDASGLAIVATSGDTATAIGVCVGGCGTTGNAQVAKIGLVSCNFDNTAVAGDPVIQAGANCHDPGSGAGSSIVLGHVVTAGTGVQVVDWSDTADAGTGSGGGGSVDVNGSAVASPNFNATTPTADANNLAGTFKVSGSNVILEFPYGTTSTTFAAGNDSRITGALQAANNLSDVANAATSRTNLNVPAIGDVTGGGFVAQAHWRFPAVVNTGNTPYTIASTDAFVRCDPSSGSVQVKLPAATGTGREIDVKNVGTSISNACTISPNGSDTIDGAASIASTTPQSNYHLIDIASGSWTRKATIPFPSVVGKTVPVNLNVGLCQVSGSSLGASFPSGMAPGQVCTTGSSTTPQSGAAQFSLTSLASTPGQVLDYNFVLDSTFSSIASVVVKANYDTATSGTGYVSFQYACVADGSTETPTLSAVQTITATVPGTIATDVTYTLSNPTISGCSAGNTMFVRLGVVTGASSPSTGNMLMLRAKVLESIN